MAVCMLGALLSASVVWVAERGVSTSPYHTYGGTLRQIVVLLFSGWDVNPPDTAVGFFGAFTALLFGVIFVATMTAEIASAWVAQRLSKPWEAHSVKCKGHVLICNGSPHLRMVVNQLLHPDCEGVQQVVVVAEECPSELLGRPGVLFVKGDPTDDEALKRAGIHQAQAAIILATDLARPAESDSRALLTALAVEALNPAIYTVVEIVDAGNARHLVHAHVDEIVSASELGAKLVVQAALNPGLARFVDSLVTFDENGEFYTADLPVELAGLTASEAMQRLHREHGCILLGRVQGTSMSLFTSPDERLNAGDRIFFVALSPPPFAKSGQPSARGPATS